MPTISQFYGILIQMYWDDKHGAHFHAYYGEYEALISILDGMYLEGKLPKRAERRVFEWFALHREELQENWKRVKSREPLKKIQGLK